MTDASEMNKCFLCPNVIHITVVYDEPDEIPAIYLFTQTSINHVEFGSDIKSLSSCRATVQQFVA